MSFQDPFDVESSLEKTGCSCGAHASQAEHDRAATLSSDDRMARVVESAVVRALIPQDHAPDGGAGEEGPEGRVHTHHLRHADHHGASHGLLQQARPQR
jgi:hypothetical protein